MPVEVRQRFERYLLAPLTWECGQTGKPGLVSWRDSRTVDLGEDFNGQRFTLISQRILHGHYYPPDAIEFYGRWMEANREIQAGDRILQRARVFPFARTPALWAMTEVYVADGTLDHLRFGYVTTAKHFGRGIWTIELTRTKEHLVLRVEALTAPQPWLYWVGMPVARWLQKRAWRRAIEEFRHL